MHTDQVEYYRSREALFRAQKELIDNIPQMYPQEEPRSEPLTDDEHQRIVVALENSGVEYAHSRYIAHGAWWIYETLNMMAYSDGYPDGDEPADLKFVPSKLVKSVTSCNHGICTPETILQRKEKDGWQDVLIDGKPAPQPFNFDSLPPGSYQMLEPIE